MNNIKNNDYFSRLRGIDLQDLLVDVENYFLEYRKGLNLPNDVTFGIELEYEKIFKIIVDEYLYLNFDNWSSINDGSLNSGGEIVSPIMHDNFKSWDELKQVCQFIKQNGADTYHNAGGHIHIGSNILGEDIEAWKIFLKLYVIYEHVLFRFAYGDKINGRKEIQTYARSSKSIIEIAIPKLNEATRLSDIYYAIPNHSRYQALNLSNISFEIFEGSKNTFEFRFPNSSTNEIIWQNNINAFAKMLLTAKYKLIDEEFLDYKFRLMDHKKSSYDFIDLENSLEFVDLIFDNNLDKIYFLRQYLKNFQENYNKKILVRAKKFVR